MAAPTDVRVESNSISTATIRWTYGGSAQIAVYRSLTSGSGFTEVTSDGARVAVGTTSYEDTGLDAATRYFYKLSDDLGSTFSSEVNVITHTCLPGAGALDVFSLPRFGDVNPIIPQTVGPEDAANGLMAVVDSLVEQRAKLDDLAARVEAVLHGRVLVPGDCVACPTNGALVLNCAGHCKRWLVVADEDIRSVTIQYCDEGPTEIDLIVPPGVTIGACGFPAALGFTGDECFQAPISGGTDGRTITISTNPGGRASPNSKSRPGVGRGTGPGSGGGGAGCTCVPTGGGNLTIKSCNANNSLKCSTTKSLKLIACGGLPPYTWTKTGSVQLSATSGASTTVTPPTNSGSAVAGTAYWVDCYTCQTCAGSTCTTKAVTKGGEYGCDDSWLSAPLCSRVLLCSSSITDGQLSGCCPTGTAVCDLGPGDCCDVRECCPSKVTQMCDKRTAGMITDGCNPCGLQQGATVTVTDSIGTQTTIILRA